MLELWFATFVMEGALLFLPRPWRFRQLMAAIIMAFIIVTSLWLMTKVGLAAALALALLGVFRCGNMLRVIKNRMHEDYLKRAVRRTSLWLFWLHPIFLGFLILPLVLLPKQFLITIFVIQFLVSAAIFIITYRNVYKLRFKMPEPYLSDRELPTVTVAIPARNETIDLEKCLRSVLACDYPKLEIIVLDDCSHDKTAEIIRNFAHDGVRFVQGEPPSERWLAKNQAYQKLYTEANGDLILFCGVDVRLGVHALRGMVNFMYNRNKSMLSVLPVRTESSPVSALIQPMRYWWELAFPRRLLNKPPVLSTCWMIGRSDLEDLGGFEAISHAVLPEAVLAREMIKADQYSFVRSSNELEVRTVKNFQAQYATAVRTRYPQLRRRPEIVLMLAIATLLFLILPFGFLISVVLGTNISIWLPALSCLLLIATHLLIVNATDPSNALMAIFTFPLAALAELFISCISMLRYEFLTVLWKDRNICIPVMHIYPKLPRIRD